MDTTVQFQGRAAIVTGAASGIGYETCRLLVMQGANVVAADRNIQGLEALRQQFAGATGTVVTAYYDAARPEAAAELVSVANAEFGGLDFLVPSAGIYRDALFATMTRDEWRETIAINLDSVFDICRAALPVFRDGGSIVLLASMAAHLGGSASHVHYGASKGGIVALARGLARELGPKLRVNVVSPGVIETGMTQSMLQERRTAIIAQTPLARIGTPAEIADVIVFLLSDAARFVTGENIHVNGGHYIG